MVKVQKQATKGQKQIYEENKSTIKFYTILSTCSFTIYTLIMWLFFYDKFSYTIMFVSFFFLIIYISAISFMKTMAKPSFSDTGSLLDGGIDLNMESGMAEYAKDLVILTALCQSLSLFSNYFLLLWLTAPCYAIYQFWTKVFAPWVFAPAPEDDPANEKKQKKLERKMKRSYQ